MRRHTNSDWILKFPKWFSLRAIVSINHTAKTTDATIALTPYEIIEITETVSSIGIGFSDVMRIDIETTSVTLSGPDGEAILVTLEEGWMVPMVLS